MKLESQDRLVIEDLRSDTKIKKVYIRYTIILMLDDGYTYHQISTSLGISEKMIQRVVQLFENSGIEGLSAFYYKGRDSALTEPQEQRLRKELSENLYKDTKEIQIFILKSFKVKLTRSAITMMLHRMGFSYKKTRVMPGKADAVQQRLCAAKLKRLKKRLKDTEALYFMDGAHPTFNTRAAYGWIEKGKEYSIPSNTGRQRVNINGAMNGEDPTEVLVDFADMINAQSTIRLLSKIEKKNPNKKKIYIISDNARYYNSRLLKEWLTHHPKIKWMPLPSYSPNLNLIERIWGFMKRERLNNYYFDTYQKFREALAEFFRNLSRYKKELNSLITWNFQIIQWD